MNIHYAAKALGGQVAGRGSITCPGPGHGKNDRSLSVTFDSAAPDGFLVNSFANDTWQACRDHVRDLLGLGSFEPGQGRQERPACILRPVEHDPAAVSRREFATSIWMEARPIGGTIVEGYLTGRLIPIANEAYTGTALRFHPGCPFSLDSGETVRLPAMVAAMVNVETSEFQGIHRTALRADGSGKAQVRGLDQPRKMLGSAKGACVKLCPDESVTYGLAIAEGIETALAVIGNFGVSPVWATLSAGMLARFPVLSGVECLSIFADNDFAKVQGGRQRQSGNEAALECAERWRRAGRESVIWTPPEVGSDFNDISGRAAA